MKFIAWFDVDFNKGRKRKLPSAEGSGRKRKLPSADSKGKSEFKPTGHCLISSFFVERLKSCNKLFMKG